MGVITKGPSANNGNVTVTEGQFSNPVTTAPNGDTAYWGEYQTNDGTQIHDYTSVTVQAAPDENQNVGNSGASSFLNSLQGAGEMLLGGVGMTAGAIGVGTGLVTTTAGLLTTPEGVGLLGDIGGPVLTAVSAALAAGSYNLYTQGVNDFLSPSDGLQGPQTTVTTPAPPLPNVNAGSGPDGLQELPTTVTIPIPPLPNINPGSAPDGLQGSPVVTYATPTLDQSKQDKHIPGTNNYIPGRSILTYPDPQQLLDDYAGTGQQIGSKPVGEAGSKERVDFGQVIGTFVDQATGTSVPTTKGYITYDSKGGAHIVPVRP